MEEVVVVEWKKEVVVVEWKKEEKEMVVEEEEKGRKRRRRRRMKEVEDRRGGEGGRLAGNHPTIRHNYHKYPLLSHSSPIVKIDIITIIILTV